MKKSIGYLLTCLVAAAMAISAGQATAKAPFQIKWTSGKCLDCKIARQLGPVAFAHGQQLWALGFLPPGEMGEGDWTVLRSRNGGRSWHEFGRSYSHNAPGAASFVDGRDGWILVPNTNDGDTGIRSTRDGGEHWHKVRLPASLYVPMRIAYFGHGVGYAHSYNDYSKKSELFFTTNDGKSWRGTSLPSGFDPAAMEFSDIRHGMLAGCLNKQVTLLSTSDGARSWSVATVATTASRDPDYPCPILVDDLRVGPRGSAVLLATKHIFGKGDTTGFVGTWETRDFGRDWRPVFQSRFAEPTGDYIGYDGPYQLGATTLIFEDRNGVVATALYSLDGGRHWLREKLQHPVVGCVAAEAKLTCAGTNLRRGFEMATITLRRQLPFQ